MALISAQRVQFLHFLKLSTMELKQGSATFCVDDVIKQTRPGSTGLMLHLKAYPPDRRLCIVNYLKQYISRTKDLRNQEDYLFISFSKPHQRVTSQTISRWIKESLTAAGIDTSVYKSHSTRAAAVSAAKRADLPISNILTQAGWANEQTFRKFYDKSLVKGQGGFTTVILQQ